MRRSSIVHNLDSSKMEDEHALTSGTAQSQETSLCQTDNVETDLAKFSSEVSHNKEDVLGKETETS